MAAIAAGKVPFRYSARQPFTENWKKQLPANWPMLNAIAARLRGFDPNYVVLIAAAIAGAFLSYGRMTA